ncbi:hypothetical protein FHS39_000190 [Streptomyces olivoverticillatus]|uniref:Uncharacterized protein n=1 Tax=Streptomyces olivoverticillatus TaxID=66427 RepID=A0A7W7LJ45_9ACTN|nr:hypothetical protein [Streptomyces olivoverticillatus]MBB4891190.1 hypothetical protein [Streptomyces olivoverticillatus]
MSYADLRELQSALTTASDIAFSLEATPAPHEADQLADALRRALAAASALGAAAGVTGCAEHPRGAVDPLFGDKNDPLPPGWGRCLLCNDRRRRAGAQRRGWR